MLTKFGDNLLPEDEINKIIDLRDNTEKYILTSVVNCFNDSGNCGYRDVIATLANSRNVSELEDTWIQWNDFFTYNQKAYLTNIQSLKLAAKSNGCEDVPTYWDMLTETFNGIDKIEALWTEIQPLYLKLHEFVKQRLVFNNLLANDTELIPIYLLGSNHGDDWTNIADLILPYPQTYQTIRKNLQRLDGKKRFLSSQSLVNNLGLENFNQQFWDNSVFNAKCPQRLINYCQSGNMIAITCNDKSLPLFIETHGFGLEIAHSEAMASIETNSNTFRNPDRYSALSDAIIEIGHTLALHPHNLHTSDLLYSYEYEVYNDQYQANTTLLLLQALRILPKLAYYISADKFRLNLLSQEEYEDVDWWKIREQYQKISGNSSQTTDWLSDLTILKNKPYYTKFFAQILQFQIFEYFDIQDESNYLNIIEKIQQNSKFKELLSAGKTSEWGSILDNELSIDSITSSALLNYFNPLLQYFEEASLEQNTEIPPQITTTTTTTTTTTIKPSTTIGVQSTSSSKENEKKEKFLEKVEDDQTKESSLKSTYIMVGLSVIIVAAILGSLLVAKLRSKNNKKQRNNRRFET